MIVTGGGTIENLAASHFAADAADFRTTLKDGVFSVDPIRVRRGSYGRIDGKTSLALGEWRRVNAARNSRSFRSIWARPGAAVDGGTNDIAVMLADAKSADPLAAGSGSIRI